MQAVNFVPADWLRYGAASMLRYRSFRKPSVLCHEELLLRVVREGSPVAAFWAARELQRAVREEARLRYHLWACVRSGTSVNLDADALDSTNPNPHSGFKRTALELLSASIS
jgi:hypothetical protein